MNDLSPLNDPYAKICDVFQDLDHIWINFDERGGTVSRWKTKMFSALYHFDKQATDSTPAVSDDSEGRNDFETRWYHDD